MAQTFQRRQNDGVQLSNRRRVDELLQHAVENPLVILSGGSGTGKTMAVSSFASHTNEQVVWIHLTPLDYSTEYFWTLFINAVDIWSKQLAQELRQNAYPETIPARHRFLEQLDREIQRRGKVVLVFDDFQNIRPGEVKEFIADLIEARIDQLSIILIAGEDVNISQSGNIRAVRLTDRQLLFTREEIRIYYTALGIVLDDEMLDRICQLTEGHAAAVYMLGMHLQKNEALTPGTIDNAVVQLFYLFELNYFSTWDAEARHSFVLLSLLDEFTLEMAVDLTSLSGPAFLSLVSDFAFISFRPESSCYYFHSLFLQFLRLKQRGIKKGARHTFLRKTGLWCQEHSAALSAVMCFVTCGAYRELSDVLEQLEIFNFNQDTSVSYLNLLNEIPADSVRTHYVVRLYKAILTFRSGMPEEASRQLLELKQDLERERTEEAMAVLGETCAMLSYVSRSQGTFEFVSYVKQASECLPNGSRLLNGKRASYLGNGNALIFPGPEPGALLRMTEALFEQGPYLERLYHGFGAGRDYLAAAEARFYQDDLSQALEHAQTALEISSSREQWDIACNACYLASRIETAFGHLGKTISYLTMLKEYAKHVSNPANFTLPDFAESGFYMKMGLVERTSPWIKNEALFRSRVLFPDSGREFVFRSAYQILKGQYYPAIAFIDYAIGVCRSNGQWFSRLKLQIHKALIYYFLGEPGIASKNLETAWEASHTNDILMPFIELGTVTAKLIQFARPRLTGIPPEWFDLVESRSREYGGLVEAMCWEYQGKAPPPYPAGLTVWEGKALQLLCQGSSPEEIGDMMSITTASVKLLLSRVYNKIGASGRAEAVKIALEKKLVPKSKEAEA